MSHTKARFIDTSHAIDADSGAATPGSRGAASYERSRDLPRLIPLWPSELEINSDGDHQRLLARLRRALRVERRRGLAGHWAYDLARHTQLLRAYRAETAAYLAARSATTTHGRDRR